MAMQICRNCEKEFAPTRDGQAHTFCCDRCRRRYRFKMTDIDNKFRESLGMDKKHPFKSQPRTKS